MTGESATVKFSPLLGHIAPLFRKHWLRLALGFAALLAVDFLQLAVPHILKRGVDLLAAGEVTQTALARLAGLILLIAVCLILLRFCWQTLIIGFSRLLERSLKNRIFSHILKMDASFFDKHATGDIMALAGNDLTAVQMACGIGIAVGVDALVISVAAVGFMAHIHPQLTLLALLPMPFLALCARILSRKLHRRFTTVQEQFAHLTEFSRSALIAIRLIQASVMEDFQTREFGALGEKYVRSNLRTARIRGLIFPASALAGNIGLLLILLFGGRLVIQESITVGEFVAFLFYLHILIWPMMGIGWVTNLVQRGLTSLERVHAIFVSTSAFPDITKQKERTTPHSHFSLRRLVFRYPSAKRPVLENISLEIGPGILGITGRTGSGKSSLCKALARLYPVPGATLFFNGRDVNSLPVSAVRSHIGYVGQEPVLFSMSIMDNLLLARPDATFHEVEKCARLAAMHDDILELPDQYETIIGERGIGLSGGQRQRLTLARALLGDRPVFLIDDALSAVDAETGHEIFTRLKNRLQGKTMLIVSNRIALLSMTDRVLIIDEGKVVAAGAHDDLLDANDFYAAMHARQLREETPP